MTQEERRKILEEHKLWIQGKGGKRSDLSSLMPLSFDEMVSLFWAASTAATLRGANLKGANMSNPDLYKKATDKEVEIKQEQKEQGEAE